MGTLRVLANSVGASTTVWQQSGAGPDQWFFARAQVNAPSFRFEATRGGDSYSDIAIDEVVVDCVYASLPSPPGQPKPPPTWPLPVLPPATPPPPRSPLPSPLPTSPSPLPHQPSAPPLPPQPPQPPQPPPMLCAVAEPVSAPCEDSSDWTAPHRGTTCAQFAQSDPGCFNWMEVGQRTYCPKACNLCPGLCADSTYWSDTNGNGCDWYAAHDLGCKMLAEVGQTSNCPVTCHQCCPYLSDNACDDGGPGSEYSFCAYGAVSHHSHLPSRLPCCRRELTSVCLCRRTAATAAHV